MTSRKQQPKRGSLWNQSSGFRATGKGYYNKLPNFSAETKGNAILHNRAVVDADPQHKMSIFCTAVSTGWNVIGSYGQTISNRAFYPQHLIQKPIVIEGVCANQYEYDKLVDFIQRHHETSLQSSYDLDTHPIEFKLFPYEVETGKVDAGGNKIMRKIHDKMRVEGYITNIKAGHQRFVNAPTFQLEMIVAYENQEEEYRLSAEMEEEVFNKYITAFGPFVSERKKPKPKTKTKTLTQTERDAIDASFHEALNDFTDFYNGLFDNPEYSSYESGNTASKILHFFGFGAPPA